MWTLKVVDAAGKALRSLSFVSASPSDFVWDGTKDSGAVVPDGVYSLQLSTVDRAANPFSLRVDNIIVNTQQAPINVAIDLAAFSPNGDGVKDNLGLTPSVPIKTGLLTWRLSIVDRNKIERWTRTGTGAQGLPARVVWDGRDSNNVALAEGQYQAEFSATYSNGHSPRILSPIFTIDRTPPSGAVESDRKAFNPAGAQGQNLVTFKMTGSREDRWVAELLDSSGKSLRSWNMGTTPSPTIEWDGSDLDGKPLPDGGYSLRISASDRAGNSFVSPLVPVLLDTEKKAVRLSMDLRAFSPNGDGVKDLLRITDSVLAKDKLASFLLSIEAADGEKSALRSWKGGPESLVETYVWDGTTDASRPAAGIRVPDGRYLARLIVSYQNGDTAETETAPFVVDTIAPTVKANATPLLFSPNGDGRLDSATIVQASSPEDIWEGDILDSSGAAVRSYSWKGQVQDFVWDGTDEAGNTVKDGVYSYAVSTTDASGNSGSVTVRDIAVDNRPTQVFVTASDTGISPNGDGYKDNVTYSLIVKLKDGIKAWRFALVDKSGAERRVFQGESNVPDRIIWDGKDASETVVQGEISGLFAVDYAKGDRATASSSVVLSNIGGPRAMLMVSPKLFSPDNDGVDDELSFSISVVSQSDIVDWRLEIDEVAIVEGGAAGAKPAERLFISWGGKGVPAPSISWDGRSAKGELVEAATDYPLLFHHQGRLGQRDQVDGQDLGGCPRHPRGRQAQDQGAVHRVPGQFLRLRRPRQGDHREKFLGHQAHRPHPQSLQGLQDRHRGPREQHGQDQRGPGREDRCRGAERTRAPSPSVEPNSFASSSSPMAWIRPV